MLGAKDLPTKDRLIDAAIESVYQYGFGDTTIAKISDLADTSLGTIHHHFESKEELLSFAMRRVLSNMHDKVIEGCVDETSPRAKLSAVIQSVLSDEQSGGRMTAVWLDFWVQAEYDEKLRRIRNIYNRRLMTNVRNYFRQILQEIGARNVEGRAYSGSLMLIAMMHGVWISHTVKEDALSDLAHGRVLVWECLESLLSRAREPLAEDEATVATSGQLLTNVSLEVTVGEIGKIEDWRANAAAGTSIYLPHFPSSNSDVANRARQASRLLDYGFQPIAHIAARNVRDEHELERIVAGMAGIGVRRFLLLGGGESKPIGKYDSALQLLLSGVLEKHGIEEVGFAGHPEQHPDQPRSIMRQALLDKIAAAHAAGIKCHIVTQFCFTSRPFFDFLDWAREAKLNVPVRIGLAGRVNAAKLVKFAISCGIGRSLLFLRKQFDKTKHLMNYSPEGLLAELAAGIAVKNYDFPIGIHFYPFSATAETLALVSAAGVELASADLSTLNQ